MTADPITNRIIAGGMVAVIGGCIAGMVLRPDQADNFKNIISGVLIGLAAMWQAKPKNGQQEFSLRSTRDGTP